MSLDGKNQFSMERVHLPKPGNSKPSISITLSRSTTRKGLCQQGNIMDMISSVLIGALRL